jgi:exosortase
MSIPTAQPRSTVLFACYTVACAAVLWSPISSLVRLAYSSDNYNHILLVPFITIVLVWMERKTIFKVQERSFVPASVLFIAGGLLVGISWTAGIHSTGGAWLDLAILGFLCQLWAGFLFFYGAKAFRAGLFPLLFLVLMAPIPVSLLDHFIGWLQAGSADVAEWVFRLSGTPVLRQGLVFVLPGVSIEVAKECSGIRSTEALLITCLLAGYLFLRTNWRRGILLAAAVPVLILKNGIRIATLTLLAVKVDPGFLTGRLHHEGGFVFFTLGLLILAPLLWWLQKSEARESPTSKNK